MGTLTKTGVGAEVAPLLACQIDLMEVVIFTLVGIRGDTMVTVVSIEPLGAQLDVHPAFKFHVQLINAFYQ